MFGKSKVKKEKPAVPETTFQLVLMMIKGFFKSIPKMGITMLIRSAIMFVAIMLFNIYMLAEVNDGFKVSVPATSPQYNFLNVAGNKLAFNTLCFLVMFLISSLMTQVKTRGVKKLLIEIVSSPIWAFKCLKSSKNTFYAFFLSFGFISIIGIFYSNTYVFLTLAISIFLGFTSKEGGMGTLTINILYSDFQRVFRYGKKKQKIDRETVGVLSISSLLALVTLMFIPSQNIRLFGIIMPIMCLAVIILVSKKVLTKRSAANMFIFMTMNLIYFTYTQTIFADDGGKPEAGGTWGNWIRSPGSGEVIKSGVQPGILGVLGGLLSSVASSMWNGIKSAADTVNEIKFIVDETIKGTVTQIASTAVHVIRRGAEEFIGVGVDLGHGIRALYDSQQLTDDFYDGMYADLTEIYDTVAGGLEAVYDGAVEIKDGVVSLIEDEGLRDAFIDSVYQNLENFGEAASTAIGNLSDAVWTEIGDVADGAYTILSDPEALVDFVGGSISDAYDIWTDPSTLFEGLAPALESAYETTGNVLGAVWNAVSETVNDPEKVYQVIKDMVGADNFSNSWDPNRGVWDRIGQALWGTFELGGAAHSVKELGAQGAQIYDDIVQNNLDDDLVRGINNLTDEAGNLGQNGAYIQVEYTNPDFIPDDTQRVLQELSEKYNVKIHVRPGNADSVSWLTNGQAIPKPVDLKMKTINSIDELIGASADQKGLVGFFQPKKPPNYDMLDELTRIKVDRRIAQRAEEYAKYSREMASSSRYSVVDNVVIDNKTQKFVAGDVDLFSVTRPDGSSLSRAEANRLESIFANTNGSNVEHGSVVSWDPSDAKYNPGARNSMVEATRRGNEGLVTFNPDHTTTTTYVRTGAYRGPRTSSLWTRLFGAEQVRDVATAK